MGRRTAIVGPGGDASELKKFRHDKTKRDHDGHEEIANRLDGVPIPGSPLEAKSPKAESAPVIAVKEPAEARAMPSSKTTVKVAKEPKLIFIRPLGSLAEGDNGEDLANSSQCGEDVLRAEQEHGDGMMQIPPKAPRPAFYESPREHRTFFEPDAYVPSTCARSLLPPEPVTQESADEPGVSATKSKLQNATPPGRVRIIGAAVIGSGSAAVRRIMGKGESHTEDGDTPHGKNRSARKEKQHAEDDFWMKMLRTSWTFSPVSSSTILGA
jgi:hypothetical protein